MASAAETGDAAAPDVSVAGEGRALRLLILLPTLALALRIFGLCRVYQFLLRGSVPPKRPAPGTPELRSRAQRIARTVMHVNRRVLPYESRCLLESLALLWLLRRAGVAATLVLGVRTLMGPFEAHAWVEYDGLVLNDAAAVRGIYEPFDLACLGAGSAASGHRTLVS